MQFPTLTVLSALAALASAQNLGDLPACAQTCVGNSLGSTNCKGLDIACICKSSGWIAGLACCIAKGCDAADQAATITFADQLCATAGVTDLPTTAGCASGASSSAAGVASSSASTMASTMMSSSMSGMSSSSMSSISGSVLSSALAGTVSMTSTAGTASMASSGSMSTTKTNVVVPASTATVQPSSASPVSTAGAGHLVGQGMGAVGGLVAALAML